VKKKILTTSILSLLILLNAISNLFCVKIKEISEMEIEPQGSIDLLNKKINEIYSYYPNYKIVGTFSDTDQQKNLEQLVLSLEEIDSNHSLTYLKAIFELGKQCYYNQNYLKAHDYLKLFLDNILKFTEVDESDIHLIPRLIAIANCIMGQILLYSYQPEDYLKALEHFNNCISFETDFYNSDFIKEDLDDIKRYLDGTHQNLIDFSVNMIQQISLIKDNILNFIQLKREKNNVDPKDLLYQYEAIINNLVILDNKIFDNFKIYLQYKIAKICLLKLDYIKKAFKNASEIANNNSNNIPNINPIIIIKAQFLLDIIKKSLGYEEDRFNSIIAEKKVVKKALKNFNSLFFFKEKEKYFYQLNELKQEIDFELDRFNQEQVKINNKLKSIY